MGKQTEETGRKKRTDWSKRRYTDEERANAVLAVIANNGNVARTAMELGIPWSTVDNWVKAERHPEAIEMANRRKPSLADKLEGIASLLAEGLDDPKKIARAPLNTVAVTLGIVIDKMRLLRWQPNEITFAATADVLGPNTSEERLASVAAALGVRVPIDFGGSVSESANGGSGSVSAGDLRSVGVEGQEGGGGPGAGGDPPWADGVGHVAGS
jgi:transposase-like protein